MIKPASCARWIKPTTPKLLFAMLVLQGFLYLSQQLHSYDLNYRKGQAVLIAVGATALFFFLLAVSWLILRLFNVKSQVSLATLLMIVPVIAIPFAWLSRDLEQAWQQKEIVEAVTGRRGYCDYRELNFGMSRWAIPPPILAWLDEKLGHDFFADVWYVDVWEPEELRRLHELPKVTKLRIYGNSFDDDDLECLEEFPALTELEIIGTRMTDAGLRHLRGARRLKDIHVEDVPITDAGLKNLRGMRELQYLRLKNTKCTWEGGQQFEKGVITVRVSVW